jgi:thiopurine S-methyltransferase
MDPQYWLDRWQRGEISFHQEQVNADLQRHWPRLDCPPSAAVYVPLCGKSRDMAWLRAQGHRVIGVDLAEGAIAGFYAALGLQPLRQRTGKLERWQDGGYELYVGDCFELGAQQLTGVRGVYDRAALIALPPELRARYARHLADTLPASCAMLLLTMDYPQHIMPGPPFAVSAAEVRALFGERFAITELEARDVAVTEPRYRKRGLEQRIEHVHLLVRSG